MVNIDALLLTMFKVVGAFTLTGLIAWLGIEAWLEFFDKTKTARMIKEFIRENRGYVEEWFLKKYGEEREGGE
ncbi:hypothetical protein [Pyrococcus kukulkanii]|nr:hypothetical protein [Pyrococcus kukulkanii]